MSNDLAKSQYKNAELLTERYRYLLEEKRLIENHLTLIKSQLIDHFIALGEKKINSVKLVEKVLTKKVTIQEISDIFLGAEDELLNKMFNCFVVEIDIPKSVDNLVMLGGYQIPLARKIGIRLEDLQLKKYYDLEEGK